MRRVGSPLETRVRYAFIKTYRPVYGGYRDCMRDQMCSRDRVGHVPVAVAKMLR